VNTPPETVSKLDAARRQLSTAISLFIREQDTISTHTLTAAGHQILLDLAKVRGVASLTKDSPHVRPERRAEFAAAVNEAENFFKHADRDPNKVLVFRPAQTEYLLLDAVLIYQQLSGRPFQSGLVYMVWFIAGHPDLIDLRDLPEMSSLLEKMGPPEEVERSDLVGFLETSLNIPNVDL